ncbi:MAG: hypothetical protein IBX50_06605 [Marinospirillum sp.]|uniref:hypothetical protein n=1 Tax=Marinospirillum sp. TaxID=2183934 RepID=UPI0019FB209E|nr:hypothetical protein [Marinospirillum sp.]MBE0506379.1 hypothetical protein [Marinospirillum sp.]
MSLLVGCGSMNFSGGAFALDPDQLLPHQASQLSCSMQSGLQSATDFAVASTGIFSLGFRLPGTLAQDIDYDRRYDEYNDCLRTAGL